MSVCRVTTNLEGYNINYSVKPRSSAWILSPLTVLVSSQYSQLNSAGYHDYDAWRHSAAYADATCNTCTRTRRRRRRYHNQATVALNHKNISCPGQASRKWPRACTVRCTPEHPNRFGSALKLSGVGTGVQRPGREADNSAECRSYKGEQLDA